MNILLTILGFALALLAIGLAASALFTLYCARKVESLLPPQGRFVDVPGARLHVREFGQGFGAGRAILLVHGLGGQSSHFSYALAALLARRYRVVAVDRPGSGWSTRASEAGPDLSSQAAALAALIERLALGQPLVVGHSLGGAVALALALGHPAKVAGLALLAPLTHMRTDVPAVFKGLTIASPLLRKLVAWTLLVPRSIQSGRQTLEQVFGPEPVPRDFGTKGGGLLSLRPAAFLAASDDLQALPARLPAQQERYQELGIPVAVLYGKDDRILDWRANGRALADKVPGARLELVAGGHMLPVTQPEVCAAFIEGVAQAAGLDQGPAASAAGAR